MSVLALYNQALNAVGVTRRVEVLTENSTEARACALWYEAARDHVMRAAHWNCLHRVRFPALDSVAFNAQEYTGVESRWTETMPPRPWLYSFTLPDDCIAPRYLDGIPFQPFIVTGSRRLCCSVLRPALVYTYKEENPDLWDSHLYLAVVYTLAAHLALPLSGKLSNRQNAVAMANDLMLDARVSDGNEVTQDHGLESTFITARETSAIDGVHYIAPFGPLLQ